LRRKDCGFIAGVDPRLSDLLERNPFRSDHPIVIPGLDPGIIRRFPRDGRVKPGHDEVEVISSDRMPL
jgi:hypothetical protein